jgi:alkanesulfonate monooxygenase SsuD/methylene tetrahydromethanopterin reductase-like flavin-dependent oxidoreductase (luciferase family)
VIVGVGLDARLGLPLDELVVAAMEAKGYGFESVWTPAGGVPDAFHVCAAWGRATGLPTGTSVVPAARQWAIPSLGSQAATVRQLTGAPFTLGIGTGGIGPGTWASPLMPDRPVGAMRDYLTGLLPTAGRASFELGLACLGPQMLRLAGELADVALPNWASPAQLVWMRERIAEGATRADRDATAVRLTMYIRVCIDDDVTAARRVLGEQVLMYSAIPGYREHFGRMGFDEVLDELAGRRKAGASTDELVDAAPDELLTAVGYYGPADGAATAYAALSQGLDETVVRVLTARPGLEPVVATMEALRPAAVRAAS